MTRWVLDTNVYIRASRSSDARAAFDAFIADHLANMDFAGRSLVITRPISPGSSGIFVASGLLTRFQGSPAALDQGGRWRG